MLPPAGEGGEPGFDTSRIYDHVGARSCRHRLCLEGGYDGANDGGWSDALADRDSGARADSFLADMALEAVDAEEGALAGAEAGGGLGEAAAAGGRDDVPRVCVWEVGEGSRRGGLAR